MAKLITKSIKGIEQNWYVKVLHCKAENKGATIATYGYFIDAESATNKQNAIELQNITFTAVSNVDIFKQVYEAMSYLLEFQDAKDC